MTVYHEEKKYLTEFREKILSGKDISQEDILELIDKFEDMTEMNSVTVKIIDRLMMNYDKLKQEVKKENPKKSIRKDILN